MRYEDLVFEPHPIFGAIRENVEMMQRLRAAHPEVPRHLVEQTMECARAEFPNGWSLSILRGMGGLHSFGGEFETCRFRGGSRQGFPTTHQTPEEVQCEIDEVATLPPCLEGGSL